MKPGWIRQRIWRARIPALAWTVGITASLMLAQWFFEHTDAGRRVYVISSVLLQSVQANFQADSRLPVVVVDISAITGGMNALIPAPTPRRELARLISAIANARPAAIGLDIDFSPDGKGWKDAATDPIFLDGCKALGEGKDGVPVFLGVYAARDDGPDVWLSSLSYKAMAADIQVNQGSADHPDPDKPNKDKVTIRASTHYLALKAPDGSPELPTMGFALANAYITHEKDGKWPEAPRLFGFIPPEWVFERASPRDGSLWGRHEGFLINYSKIDQLHHETLLTVSKTSATEFAPYFAHKIVILGDDASASANDTYVAPDRSENDRGVYANALSAYTFAIAPLYEFEWYVRVLLDALATVPLMLTILLAPRPAESADAQAARLLEIRENRIAWGSALLVIAAGLLLIAYLQVMWVDFGVVAAAQIVHPQIQRLTHWIKRSRAHATTHLPGADLAADDSVAARVAPEPPNADKH